MTLPSSAQPIPARERPLPNVPWEVEIEHLRERSERRAWWVAAVSAIVALAAVTGLSTLAPYRRNIPYLIALDRATGSVEVIGTLDDRVVKGYQEILDKHWLQFYVTARESYFYKMLQQDYDAVLAFSSDDVGKDFARIYDGPNARDKKYGANIEIAVAVISIQVAVNAVGPQAVIRFSQAKRTLDSNIAEPTRYYVATVSYKYQPGMFGKEKDMLRNPLGFKITGYRVDAELAPMEVNAATPSNAIQGD